MKGIGPSKYQGIKTEDLPAKNSKNVEMMNKMITKSEDFNKSVRKNHILKARLEYRAGEKNGLYDLGFSFVEQKEGGKQLSFINSMLCTRTSALIDKILSNQHFYKLTTYSVFGKEAAASSCPQCQDEKVVNFDLLENFIGFDYPLLFDLHAYLNLGTVYSDINPEDVEKGINDIIQGMASSKALVFKILYGARQVTFNFFYSPNLHEDSYYMMPNNEDFEIFIYGYTNDVGTGKDSIYLKAHRKQLSAP